jgi:hypothetical protein
MAEAKKSADKKAGGSKEMTTKTYGPFDGATEIVGPDKRTHVIPAGVKATFRKESVWVLEKKKV